MKIEARIAVYKAALDSTDGLPFGKRNLILHEVARSLNLKHFHSWDGFELFHPRRRDPILCSIH